MKKKRDIGRCIIGVSAGLAVIGCTYGCKHILKQEYDQEYDNEDISGADPSDIDEQDDKPAEALLEKAELKDLDTAVMENQNGEPGSLTVEQSQKSFRPYKACIFLSNFACGYCVILRDVL